jgi:signal-transduction protein with cAMP-binding, CBS, and nucleotidyltransferase domain
MTSRVHTYPLISIHQHASVQEAAQLMADCHMGAVGVMGPEHEFVGILTERDLMDFVARGKDPHEIDVAEVVNHVPTVVEGPLEDSDALDRMKASHIRHLIVKEDDDFRIVSMRDLVLQNPHDDLLKPLAVTR